MKRPIFLALILFSISAQVEGKSPYKATFTAGSQSGSAATSNIVDLVEDLSTAAIQKKLSGYTSTSPLSLDLNLRGLDATASYGAGSAVLNVQIPQEGVSLTFSGSTREESNRLFEEYYLTGGHNASHWRKVYAEYTPIDPIAGNPNSLLSLMAAADYNLARLDPLSGCSECKWSSQSMGNEFQLGLSVGKAMIKGWDTIVITAPLRYSYSPQHTWALILDLPVTFLDNGSAWSVDGSVALGVRIPVVYTWTLTPEVRWGLGGSLSLATLGSFIDAGLNSNINIPISDFVLGITNFAGYYGTIPLTWGGIRFDYDLSNVILKNGIHLTTCRELCICNIPFNFDFAITDSLFLGDKLYIEHYDEVSFFVICNHLNALVKRDSLLFGASYQFGEKGYNAYTGTVAYQF